VFLSVRGANILGIIVSIVAAGANRQNQGFFPANTDAADTHSDARDRPIPVTSFTI
jgi:hypothetical protein